MINPDRVGTCTLAGTRYGELNQDHVEVHELFTAEELSARPELQQCIVAVVMDGHGLLGEKCARRSGRAVAASLTGGLLRQRALSDLDEVELKQIFEHAFYCGHQAGLQIYEDPPATYIYPKGSPAADRYTLNVSNKVPMYHSRKVKGDRLLEFGTTCTVALLQGSTLAVANVGDSSAVLGRKKGTLCSSQSLTVRHWGGNPDEVRRVMVKHSAHVSFLRDDGYLSIDQGQWRGYQLSMTRALGHKMLANYGVIANPSVMRVRVTPDDFCLVLASDGVWDVYGENEVVRMVAEQAGQGAPAARIAAVVAKDAVKTGIEGGDADNTTVAVLLL